MIVTRIGSIIANSTRRQRLTAAVGAVVILLGVSFAHFRHAKSIICVDGKRVVCLPSEGEARKLLQEIKSSSGCNPDEVEFRQHVVVTQAPGDARPVSRHKALTLIRTAVSPIVCRWSIIVDGKPVVAVPSRKVAGEVLDLAKLKFGSLAKNLAEEPQFKENIKVDMAAVSPGIYRATADKALALVFEKPVAKFDDTIYVVRKGDVACAIASRNGITIDRLQAMNPGVDLVHLQIGDKLRMKAAQAQKPKLTVVVRDMDVRVESTPPPVRRVSSAKLYVGKTSLLSPGKWGKRKVRAADVYENGRKVGVEVLEEETIEAPSPRIIAAGIKPRPTWN
jgi:LysM repeat protein